MLIYVDICYYMLLYIIICYYMLLYVIIYYYHYHIDGEEEYKIEYKI